jgi:hypothetical protein
MKVRVTASRTSRLRAIRAEFSFQAINEYIHWNHERKADPPQLQHVDLALSALDLADPGLRFAKTFR